MGFLNDYIGQKKRFGLGTIVLVATLGVASGYCLKGCNSKTELNSIQSKNLGVMEELMLENSCYAGPSDSSDSSELMYEFFDKLPNKEKTEIMKKVVNEQTKDWWYEFKNYCENNLESLSSALIGSGSSWD
jgi:hypothetical protein